MDEKRINEIYEGIQDGAIAPPVTEMLECLRLARLGLWAEKHREAIDDSLNHIVLEWPESSTKKERAAIEEMPRGDAKVKKPKPVIEFPCVGGNYYVVDLSDCTLPGLRRLKKHLDNYLKYWKASPK